ncbi:MAG: hypothetical protein WBG48_15320 [Pricia sp.]
MSNAIAMRDAQIILNREIQMRRLKYNQRDLALFYGKLRSYVCEPKTFEQFNQWNHLRENAEQLRNANLAIIAKLKGEGSSLSSCSKMLSGHLNNFNRFREDIMLYVKAVKSQNTETP